MGLLIYNLGPGKQKDFVLSPVQIVFALWSFGSSPSRSLKPHHKTTHDKVA